MDMSTYLKFEPKQITLASLVALVASCLLSTTVAAQAVERIYAANSCNSINYGSADEGTWDYNDNGYQGLDSGQAGSDGEFDLVCPIVRQKVGSAAGAKFYVFIDQVFTGSDQQVSCTMTSRRPHNGALVSSGSRSTSPSTPSNQPVLLARSINPSSTYGHYSLTCTSNSVDPLIHSYRIREF